MEDLVVVVAAVVDEVDIAVVGLEVVIVTLCAVVIVVVVIMIVGVNFASVIVAVITLSSHCGWCRSHHSRCHHLRLQRDC